MAQQFDDSAYENMPQFDDTAYENTPTSAPSTTNAWEAGGLGAIKGATAGLAPYFGAIGHMLPIGGPGLNYSEGLAQEKARYAQAEAEHPMASMGGNIVGGLPSAAATAVGSVPAMMAKGAALGAVGGAANSNSIPGAVENGLTGGVFGGAINAVPGAIGGVGKLYTLAKSTVGRKSLADALQKAADSPDIQQSILQNMKNEAANSTTPKFTVNTPEDMMNNWFAKGEKPTAILDAEPGTPAYEQLLKTNPALAPQKEGQLYQLIRDLQNPKKSPENIKDALAKSDATLPYGMLHRTVNETIPGFLPSAMQGASGALSKLTQNPFSLPTEAMSALEGFHMGGVGGAVAGLVGPPALGAAMGATNSVISRNFARNTVNQISKGATRLGPIKSKINSLPYSQAMKTMGNEFGQQLAQTPWNQ